MQRQIIPWMRVCTTLKIDRKKATLRRWHARHADQKSGRDAGGRRRAQGADKRDGLDDEIFIDFKISKK